MRDVNWGDAPTWVASILSGVSVLLALTIIRRDRRGVQESQARRIQWVRDIDPWASFVGQPHRVLVRNESDGHVMDLRLRLYPKGYFQSLLEYDRWERERMWDSGMIQALDAAERRIFEHNVPSPVVAIGLSFRTAALMPGEEKELVLPAGVLDGGRAIAFRDIQTLLEFRDASNNVWHRDVITGRLKVRPYAPAKSRVRF